METGARTPEELETLLEDAFLTRDRDTLGRLFADGAVLLAGHGRAEARGREEIAAWAAAMWRREATYLADPERVVQSRDTALVVSSRGVSVARRCGADGAWRYAIALLRDDDTMEGERR